MDKITTKVIPDIRKVITKLNGDVVILITSNIYGAGKSTLSMMIAKAVWDKFCWQDHMTYDAIDFLKCLRKKSVKVIIQDEGKRLGKRTDFMQKQTKYIENVLSESRKLNKCIIINVGEMHRIFKWLGNERATVWFHIFKRGKVLVFQARNYIIEGNKFGVRPDTFKNIRGEAGLLKGLTSLPSFCFVDTFPQFNSLITEEDYKEYENSAEDVTTKYIDEVIKELEFDTSKKTGRTKIDYENIVKEVLEKKKTYLKTWGGRTFVDTGKIQTDFNIGYTAARKIKTKAEDLLKIT